MKITFLALFLSVSLLACKPRKNEKTYSPRALTTNESFNEFPDAKDNILTIVQHESSDVDLFAIQYKDTIISIKKDPKPVASKFSEARYLNSQKTALLVQVADGSGLVSPFYIVYLKNGNLQVIDLDRASKGKNDSKITKGLEEISRTSFIVNNDFLITSVNGTVYPIKRQEPNERIQGKFFMYSSDRTTLVFLTENSLYQVNYKTGETLNLPVDASLLNQPETLVSNIQQGYSWIRNDRGTLFLLKNPDEDRIVDIKEFKH
ncbi:hypothetical protein DHW03_17015 [Pedobacter yonginense]|uniref:Uncharacterized protein n=1 Tax=Pedobacter yonginense TaxID=651869 RepID=A0A317EK68_9SPHI|nr:hypothetical protein [Pedobacter yonginense]PWS26479.1 hypothetical protein DHW03_17015 [Pedobacter yonginense]